MTETQSEQILLENGANRLVLKQGGWEPSLCKKLQCLWSTVKQRAIKWGAPVPRSLSASEIPGPSQDLCVGAGWTRRPAVPLHDQIPFMTTSEVPSCLHPHTSQWPPGLGLTFKLSAFSTSIFNSHLHSTCCIFSTVALLHIQAKCSDSCLLNF